MEGTINKRFLLSTLAEVGAHNRREQEEECWRRLRLETEADRTTTFAHGRNRTRKGMKYDNSSGDRHRSNNAEYAEKVFSSPIIYSDDYTITTTTTTRLFANGVTEGEGPYFVQNVKRVSGNNALKRGREKGNIRNRIGGSPNRRKVEEDSSAIKLMEDTRAEWAERKRQKMESTSAVVLSIGVEENREKTEKKKQKKSIKKQKLSHKKKRVVMSTTPTTIDDAETAKNADEEQHKRLVVEAVSAVVRSFASGKLQHDNTTHQSNKRKSKKRKKGKKATKKSKVQKRERSSSA